MAKKKRGTKLLLLSLVLIAVCGAAYLATKYAVNDTEEPVVEEESSVESEIILALNSTSFNEIKVKNSKDTLSFTKTGDKWSYSEDSAFPLDSSLMTNISSSFTHLESYKKIENAADLSEYGLDTPLITATATGTDVTATIEIGDAAPMDSLRYVSIGDGNVYLVDNSIFTNMNVELYDLLKMEDIPGVSDFVSISVDDTTITCVAAGGESEEEATHKWFINETEVDAVLVETLYNSISGITWVDCVNYNADDSALAEFGFTEPQLKASVVYTEEDTEKSYGLEFAANTEDDSLYYARMSNSSMVYSVSAETVEAIKTAFSDITASLQ